MKNNINIPESTEYLKLLKVVTIPPTKTGKGMNNKNMGPFRFIDYDFTEWNAQTILKNTDEATVAIYKQVKDGYYSNIFNPFNKEFSIETETHEQIKVFIEKNSHLFIESNVIINYFFENTHKIDFYGQIYRQIDGKFEVDVGSTNGLDTFKWKLSPNRYFIIFI